MTSKEALERVKTAPEYGYGHSVYRAYTNSSIAFFEDIEIIKKDLEVLEILRRNVFKSDSSISIILDDLRNFEDFNKIKEWLEDDNNN